MSTLSDSTESVPVMQEDNHRVPTSHRWGHRQQSPASVGLCCQRSPRLEGCACGHWAQQVV